MFLESLRQQNPNKIEYNFNGVPSETTAHIFFGNCQTISYPRTSQHFVELEGSLPCSQQPSTVPYSELKEYVLPRLQCQRTRRVPKTSRKSQIRFTLKGTGPFLWPGGQRFWLQIQRSRFDSRRNQIF
jgi:hypothetical protein